jgi:hypothetical protein
LLAGTPSIVGEYTITGKQRFGGFAGISADDRFVKPSMFVREYTISRLYSERLLSHQKWL